MKLIILASGSKANAALLEVEGRYILIDAGLSATQLRARIALAGVKPGEVTAIILTHEHNDHAVGLEKFAAGNSIPVYANAMTAQAIIRKTTGTIDWRIFNTGDGFFIGDIYVETFNVNHDAAEPCGFLFSHRYQEGNTYFGFATDLGEVDAELLNHCFRATTLFIEANYDEQLLEMDRTRPYSVRTRISSKNGHLSNQQAAEACLGLPCLRKVILGHLSGSTNDPVIAAAHISRLFTDPPEIEVALTPESKRCDPPLVIDIL